MPFISSPIDHNPRLSDLFNCIPAKDRKHELLARYVRNNTEIKGQLFTTVSDIDGFGNVAELAQKYNEKLWYGHLEHSKLVIENGQIFINGYKDDTCWIINKLKSLSSSGVQNYSNSVDAWLDSPMLLCIFRDYSHLHSSFFRTKHIGANIILSHSQLS